MFLSAKNRPQGPIPMVSTQKFQSMNTPKKGGRPPLGRARKQEYRITALINKAAEAMAVAAMERRRRFEKQKRRTKLKP